MNRKEKFFHALFSYAALMSMQCLMLCKFMYLTIIIKNSKGFHIKIWNDWLYIPSSISILYSSYSTLMHFCSILCIHTKKRKNKVVNPLHTSNFFYSASSYLFWLIEIEKCKSEAFPVFSFPVAEHFFVELKSSV